MTEFVWHYLEEIWHNFPNADPAEVIANLCPDADQAAQQLAESP